MTAVTNGRTVPSLGLNDPRLANLAREFRMHDADSRVVATNSFHILDLHTGIPSVPITTEAEAVPYETLFWVTMPKVDLTGAVRPMPRPGPAWCEERRLSGGIVFARCEPAGPR